MENNFLPITKNECLSRGWDEVDFVYVNGDAYVDHPSFGAAIITRVLENAGFRVAFLAQPDYKSCEEFKKFGKPRLGFLVSAGNIDSMVAHYTASKKKRSYDYYSAGGEAGKRPDRAVIVYCNRIREAYGDVPIIIGGLEASLRRFAHYDYWDNKIRRSILVDSRADILTYGMGENIILRIAKLLDKGVPIKKIRAERGCVYLCKPEDEVHFQVACELDYNKIKEDKREYARAFGIQYKNQDAINGKAIVEYYDNKKLVQNPPAFPLEREELDKVYALPYMRTYHPSYEAKGGVPAISEVKFSLTHNRGCFGGCNFCALAFHQGRSVRSRSIESVVSEAKIITEMKDFKGYIHDVGGPTANFRYPACKKQLEDGVCTTRKCLAPTPCPNLEVDHSEYIELLKRIEELPKVKKVFIRSGIRFDYMIYDKSDEFFRKLVRDHVSGQLKVAPEHCSSGVLKYMGKPDVKVYDKFREKYFALCKEYGLEQYLVPYLMSSHPGSTPSDAVELALYLKDLGLNPEQVQDFYPTPGTASTVMYYTGINPLDGKEVYCPTDYREKLMQRALLQYKRPENRNLVREALILAGREDLIGFGNNCLVKPDMRAGSEYQRETVANNKNTPKRAPSKKNSSNDAQKSKSNQKNLKNTPKNAKKSPKNQVKLQGTKKRQSTPKNRHSLGKNKKTGR
ncbi:MAG: YgiQ family radical SAM protein [Clostridia bacterium]|nr:YgiQ family radical SAM protein [Clostridia bacterium]